MTHHMKEGEIYWCLICGNEVKILKASKGVLTCCNQPMVKSTEDIVTSD
ncbi:MAG: desulfoferrodoxin FeS4 iron-binding domain-containing protein [Methanocellales archaeon]